MFLIPIGILDLLCSICNRAISLWPWKTVSFIVRDVFSPPVVERKKTSFARFPTKNIPYMRRGLYDWPIRMLKASDVKASFYFAVRSLLCMFTKPTKSHARLPPLAKPTKLVPCSLFVSLVVFKTSHFQSETKIALFLMLCLIHLSPMERGWHKYLTFIVYMYRLFTTRQRTIILFISAINRLKLIAPRVSDGVIMEFRSNFSVCGKKVQWCGRLFIRQYFCMVPFVFQYFPNWNLGFFLNFYFLLFWK